MKARPPACAECGKQAKVLLDHTAKSMGVSDARYFCTIRCAAKWAIYHMAASQSWCGRDYLNDPDCDSMGPHGWHDDPSGECPECEAAGEVAS